MDVPFFFMPIRYNAMLTHCGNKIILQKIIYYADNGLT